MKAKHLLIAILSLSAGAFAQDRTTVTATTNDISDNLDLRAVASIFGDSKDLEDFERRLNDPKKQISNLDLNRDNQVDYLRVVESVEGNTHLIVVQSVLDKDVFQDVATVEVEKGRNNNVQVQVVGDVYMYGSNYIYEPVYVYRPMIYDYFWVSNYRPYFSSWYWNYYPSYYYAWQPYPIFYYQDHIYSCINSNHNYNYVNYRRSERAMAMHNGRRSNGYERLHPKRSFAHRNDNVKNRYELDKVRTVRTKQIAASSGSAPAPKTVKSAVRAEVQPNSYNAASTPRNETVPVRTKASASVRSDYDASAPKVATPAVRTKSIEPAGYNTVSTPRPQQTVPVRATRTESSQIAPGYQQAAPIRSASPRVNFNTQSVERSQSSPSLNSSGNVRFGGRR